MILDFVPSTDAFILKVPRGSADLQDLMRETGLDFSLKASTEKTGVLFTHEPYAAAAFAEYATPEARAKMAGLLAEIEASWKSHSDGHFKVPDDKELWDFQKADLEYALRRKNTLIGDQPGLGKTPTAIAFANEINAKRVLVICPASIRDQWVKRIREWTTMRWPYIIHPIINGRRGVHPDANWTVVSYELARSEAIGRALAKGRYDCLILDEGHYLKTVDTRRTRAVFGGGAAPLFEPLAGRADTVLALTGTPLPNRPREAYTLARGLCFDSIDWMSEDRFKERFNPSVMGTTPEGKIYVDERTGRHAELQSRLRGNFMTRHLKKDVMTQLKLPIYDVVSLEETEAVRKALKAESMLDIDPEAFDKNHSITADGQWSTARKEMGLALLPQFIDYIRMVMEGGEEKLLVFAWHIEVMNKLETALAKYGVCRWHAGQAKRNDALKEEFIRNPKKGIALGNLLTMGTGVDGFQEVCTHAIILEPDPVPGNNQQCIDRLDRGGQKGTVLAEIMVAPGSLLEKILGSALRKLQTTDKALDRRITK